MTMEIFVYLHSNDVSVEGGRNNYRFPFIISIKLNGCDDRNLTDMREKKNYGRNSFRWCPSTLFTGIKFIMIKEKMQRERETDRERERAIERKRERESKRERVPEKE